MRAQTPAEFIAALRWAQLAAVLLFVSITWFVRIYLRAGRPWLAWTITGLRTFYLLLTFLAGIECQLLVKCRVCGTSSFWENPSRSSEASPVHWTAVRPASRYC